MSGSIAASNYVAVTPSVISAQGNGLSLIGLILTTNTRVPIGTVPSFPNLAAVGAYFGLSSTEYALASVYFQGYVNSTIKPSALLFSQYPWTSPVAAYTRGASVAGLSVTQLAAISGTLSITVNSTAYTASSLNLSAANSFSSAANIINTALAIPQAAGATITGTVTAGVLTVTAQSVNPIQVGDQVTGLSPTTYISSFGMGTGGTGTYNVTQTSPTGTATGTTRSAVNYDSISGGFTITSSTTGATSTINFASGTTAAALGLTQAVGAVTSQGAAIYAPASAMAAIAAVTMNWGSFMTTFEPVIADKVSFAAWNSSQPYVYSCWDTNTANAGTPPATGTALQSIIAAGYQGTVFSYLDLNIAAGLMGYIASLNFNARNGAAVSAFKSFSGVTPSVYSSTTASNLLANGQNYYGYNANPGNNWSFFYNGQVTGTYKFLDAYVYEIWLTQGLQTALLNLLTSAPTIPYNAQGYALIEAACSIPIAAALNFGAISPGVTLSATQIAEVNNAAGLAIDSTLSTRGWYLQVTLATPAQRAARSSPPITLWYMYAGSVQQINMASILVQ